MKMKKIMLVVCGCLFAFGVQAAAVNWNSGAVYKTDGSAKVGKGATDYVVSVLFFTDSAGTTAVSGLTGDTSVSVSGTGSKYSGIVDGFTGGETYYAQIVITTAGYEAKSEVAQFVAGTVGDTSLNFASGEGFAVTSPKLDTSAAGSWQPAAIPEPTSGLLLLLGVAGLALKRKRA